MSKVLPIKPEIFKEKLEPKEGSQIQQKKYKKYNIFSSFYYAFCGIFLVFSREKNPWFQFGLGIFCVIISLFLQNNVFAAIHLVLMLLTLSQEIMNTALEELCDMIDSNYNKAIKKIKDISAGSVLVGSLAWLFVIIFQIAITISKYKLQISF
jgi:diacylglycerol kinase